MCHANRLDYQRGSGKLRKRLGESRPPLRKPCFAQGRATGEFCELLLPVAVRGRDRWR